MYPIVVTGNILVSLPQCCPDLPSELSWDPTVPSHIIIQRYGTMGSIGSCYWYPMSILMGNPDMYVLLIWSIISIEVNKDFLDNILCGN